MPWSLELLERFEDSWDWSILARNTALSMPALHDADVIEIMMQAPKEKHRQESYYI
ncbi:hypothetical protein BQ8794_10148 [Mesorhizobium prunaredense]|uniref:Uncharacterized protein n=1 Tax=Mesorhizobium prunaredense TaxID=1631249 RepID=A0A1R3UYS8_9HYPH|nr:hypothetical protein BQ8794_10148 [Mesorhizobium prunaredense]